MNLLSLLSVIGIGVAAGRNLKRGKEKDPWGDDSPPISPISGRVRIVGNDVGRCGPEFVDPNLDCENFSLNARLYADGSAEGQLSDTYSYTGGDLEGNAYEDHYIIDCINFLTDDTVILSGMITISTQDPAFAGNVFITAARILEDGTEEYTGPIWRSSSTEEYIGIDGPLPHYCKEKEIFALIAEGGKFFDSFFPHQSGQFDIDAPQEQGLSGLEGVVCVCKLGRRSRNERALCINIVMMKRGWIEGN